MERYPLAALVLLVAAAGLAAAEPPAPPPDVVIQPQPPATPASTPAPDVVIQPQPPSLLPPPAPAVVPAAPAAPAAPACSGFPCSCFQEACCCCTPQGRLTVGAEYLLWWVKDGSAPPLVTTGSGPNGGIFGDPSTRVLFGGTNGLDYGAFSGGRVTACYQPGSLPVGVEVSGFLLEQRSDLFGGASDAGGSPLLARPVFNAQTGAATASLVSAPGAFAGNLAADSREQLWGVEGNATGSLYANGPFRVNWLAGVRYLQLDDDLDLQQNVGILGAGIAGFEGGTLNPGNSVSIADRFATRSQFVGGQVGAKACYQQGRVGVDVTAKVALGPDHETLDVLGTTTLGRPGAGPVAPGGLLALPSNSGHFTQDEFTVVPEVCVQVSYQLTSWLRASVGYDFLYMSDVLRAGDQVSLNVNPRQVPTSLQFNRGAGPIQPAVLGKETDFWAQGLTFGVELRY
jgi:hypothetical protein